jgi:hypothetical protein
MRGNIGGNSWRGRCYGSGSGSKRYSVNEVKIETVEVMSEVECVTVSNNDKGVILVVGCFVDSRSDFVLGTKTSPVTIGCLPRKIEFSCEERKTIRACSTGADVGKELDDFRANDQKEIGRERVFWRLREEFSEVNRVAGEAIEDMIGELDRDLLETLIGARHSGL